LPAPTPPFSLSSYCSKKLRRLYRALKMTHGKGRYVKRKLEPDGVTEAG
jgi:hypothetical protein